MNKIKNSVRSSHHKLVTNSLFQFERNTISNNLCFNNNNPWIRQWRNFQSWFSKLRDINLIFSYSFSYICMQNLWLIICSNITAGQGHTFKINVIFMTIVKINSDKNVFWLGRLGLQFTKYWIIKAIKSYRWCLKIWLLSTFPVYFQMVKLNLFSIIYISATFIFNEIGVLLLKLIQLKIAYHC